MVEKEERLNGVDEKLQQVVKLAATYVPFPIIVVEGVRTKERQRELYAQGRSKPGKVVTWTLQSKHIEGKAVDLAPYVDRKIPWEDTLLFVVIGEAMLEAAQKLNVKIKWGFDWDMDGRLREQGETDGPHFELV